MGGPISNPISSKTKRRAARVAGKLAYRIWTSVKKRGYAIPVPKRTPKIVKTYVRHILKANQINWKIKNPPDKTAARELELYLTNDGNLYRSQYLPILKNLILKVRKGIFRKHMAARLFMYLVDSAAKKYEREFGTPGTWNVMFPRRTRLRVARSLVSSFLVEARHGNYNNLLPAKYRNFKAEAVAYKKASDWMKK